jgi:uncharacterized membrane protein YphA (DoxX/SURF4 family)
MEEKQSDPKKWVALFDQWIVSRMAHPGHLLERWLLGILFLWFGLLKVFGEKSASSIIAKSAYWFDPAQVVPALGWWEFVIGIALIFKPLTRLALLLLFIRLPGTLLALAYHYEECFRGGLLTPTIQGQYLLKELTLVGAALVIGSTVREPS